MGLPHALWQDGLKKQERRGKLCKLCAGHIEMHDHALHVGKSGNSYHQECMFKLLSEDE